jgi:hypothetical protein
VKNYTYFIAGFCNLLGEKLRLLISPPGPPYGTLTPNTQTQHAGLRSASNLASSNVARALLPAAFSAQGPEMNDTPTASQIWMLRARLSAFSMTLFLRWLLRSAEVFPGKLVDVTFLALARALTTGRLAFLEATEAAGIRDCMY